MADLVGPENAVTRQSLEKLPAEHARRADDEDRFQVSVRLTKTDDVTIEYAEFVEGRRALEVRTAQWGRLRGGP